MRRRSLLHIEADLVNRLGIPAGSKRSKLVARAVREAQANGIRMAAAVASDYDKYNSHSHLVSDCILWKLNVLKGRLRKNPASDALDNAVRRLESKVDSLDGTIRFMARAARAKLAQKR